MVNTACNIYLTMPSVAKEEKVETIENNVEDESSRGQEFAMEPALAHIAKIKDRSASD